MFKDVRYEVDTHFSLGCLNGSVGLTRRNRVTLAEKLEMVNEGLHALFHGCPGWGYKLVVIDLDGASGDLV